MRITLIHNPTAGQADHEPGELIDLLRAADHEVRYHTSAANGLGEALEEPADLLLIAGGDGTIRKVVRRLIRDDLVLAILPLGTANNIASTLGIDALATARPTRMDVGIARAPWGKELFLESAGLGCFAALLHQAKGGNVAKPVTLLRRLIDGARTHRCKIVADGKDLSGEFVMIEVLNMPRIGSGFEFAPRAEVGDGWLDLLLVGERERGMLIEDLDRVEGGAAFRTSVPLRRVKRVRVEWILGEGHVDDEAWPEESGEVGESESMMVELELAQQALRFAVPERD
jgi:diacylglycerol kinase family enzyme